MSEASGRSARGIRRFASQLIILWPVSKYTHAPGM